MYRVWKGSLIQYSHSFFMKILLPYFFSFCYPVSHAQSWQISLLWEQSNPELDPRNSLLDPGNTVVRAGCGGGGVVKALIKSNCES